MGLEATVSSQVDEQAELSDSLEINHADNSRVTEFWSFVAENSSVIVESPRLPGVEMPFGALMAMCSATVTEQNVDRFYAESCSLLAAAKEKSLEPEEKTEEADIDEVEIKTEQEAIKTDKPLAKVEKQPKEEPVTPKKEALPSPVKGAPAQTSSEITTLEPTLDASDVAPKKATIDSKKLTVAGPPSHPAASETVASPSQDTTPPAAEKPANAAPPVSEKVVELRPEIPQTEVVTPVQAEFQLPVVETPKVLAAEIKPPVPDTNIEAELPAEGPEKFIAISEKEDEKIDYDFPLPTDVSIDRDSSPSIEVLDMAILTDSYEEEKITYEKLPLVVQEKTEYEVLAKELSVPVEEIETTVEQLSAKVETLEPSAAEEVNQILDEIIQLPRQLETPADAEEEVANEQEVRKKLEKLFTELLDRPEIEYTPELIDSFVSLAFNRQLEEIAEPKAPYEAEGNVPKDRGTHEAITKILICLTDIKKVLLRAYALGKSAMYLYQQQESPAY